MSCVNDSGFVQRDNHGSFESMLLREAIPPSLLGNCPRCSQKHAISIKHMHHMVCDSMEESCL